MQASFNLILSAIPQVVTSMSTSQHPLITATCKFALSIVGHNLWSCQSRMRPRCSLHPRPLPSSLHSGTPDCLLVLSALFAGLRGRPEPSFCHTDYCYTSVLSLSIRSWKNSFPCTTRSAGDGEWITRCLTFPLECSVTILPLFRLECVSAFHCSFYCSCVDVCLFSAAWLEGAEPPSGACLLGAPLAATCLLEAHLQRHSRAFRQPFTQFPDPVKDWKPWTSRNKKEVEQPPSAGGQGIPGRSLLSNTDHVTIIIVSPIFEEEISGVNFKVEKRLRS